MIKNNRIEAITSELKGLNTILDIGCDHGLVIKKALDYGFIKAGIAADINKEPLESAKNNLKGYANVEYRISDGFTNITETFDGVVIAGMGSHLIVDIMQKAPKKADIVYILQANSKHEILRKFLSVNNFAIIDETLVFDKFYYIIIKVIRGNQKLNEEELYLGPVLMTKDSSLEYYKVLLNRYYHLVNQSEARGEAILSKIRMLENIIKIKEI